MLDSGAMPHDAAAERAVLGALMLRPDAIPQIRERLSASQFYSAKHALIYEALADCYSAHKNADPILLKARLTSIGKLDEAGGIVYVAGLLDGVPRSSNADRYAAIVSDHAARREAINAGTIVQALATEPGGVTHVASYMRNYAEAVEKSQAFEEPHRIAIGSVLEGDEPPIPWIVEDWLAEQEVAQLAGEWATGKSYIALDLALSLARGIPWMNKIDVAKPVSVLYVDEENTEHTARRRLRRMILGRQIEESALADMPISYLHRNGLLLDEAKGLSALRREIDKSKAKVVILDSLFDFLSSDMNDNKAIIQFYRSTVKRLAGEHNCAIIVLDHMRKPGENDENQDPAHRIIGGSMKSNIVDETWTVTLTGTRNDNTRTLSASKARAGDQLPQTVTTRFQKSEDETAVWIEATDAKTPVVADAVVVSLLIESAENGMRSSDLVEEVVKTGCHILTAKRAIKRRLAANDIAKRKEGRQGVRYWATSFAPGLVVNP